MKTLSLQKNSVSVIKRLHITEKAGVLAENSPVYTFEVTDKSTKASIAAAVKEIYKVTALKVNIVRLPAKKIFSKGKRGSQKGMKKAYVYLKKGDKIEFV